MEVGGDALDTEEAVAAEFTLGGAPTEQGDVLDTEEAVAAEFALGGPAASYRGQWLCVKAAFAQKEGIVFLSTALEGKVVADSVANSGGGGCQCNLTHHHPLTYEPILHHHDRPSNRFQGVLIAPAGGPRLPRCFAGPQRATPDARATTQPPTARAHLLSWSWY